MASRRHVSHSSNGSSDHEFDDYLQELNYIQEDKIDTNNKEDDGTDDELENSKTPDEGEQELAWLNDAGFGHLAEKYEAGKELEEETFREETSSLTRAQANAVKKRVDTLNATIRKRHKHPHKTDVRDVFSTDQSSPKQDRRTDSCSSGGSESSLSGRGSLRSSLSNIAKNKNSYRMTGDHSVQNPQTSGVEMISIQSVTVSGGGGGGVVVGGAGLSNIQNTTITEIQDANASITFTEPRRQCGRQTTVPPAEGSSSIDGMPYYTLSPDALGVTHVCDLGRSDLARLRPLAHIEFTSIFDINNITYMRRKSKRKGREHGIFGVSLKELIEKDQKKYGPEVQIPRIISKLIQHLEINGITEEGILRVPGSVSRIRQLKQEINEKFRDEKLVWDEIRPNDAAGLLKQFIRELPTPLLTMEYIDAFAQVEAIPDFKVRIQALNQLVLLLPDVHRNTLLLLLSFLQKVVVHEGNLMNLNNVAMIMAPNLFLVSSKKPKSHKDVEIRLAAGTATIVKMLIKYQSILMMAPPTMLAQIRCQNEKETHKRKRDKLIEKFLGRKDRGETYKKPVILCESDFNDGKIRVLAPELAKHTFTVKLAPEMCAFDVVNNIVKLTENVSTENGRLISKADMSQLHLYETGGNIGVRRLAPDTHMLSLLRTNPNAEWFIRPFNEHLRMLKKYDYS